MNSTHHVSRPEPAQPDVCPSLRSETGKFSHTICVEISDLAKALVIARASMKNWRSRLACLQAFETYLSCHSSFSVCCFICAQIHQLWILVMILWSEGWNRTCWTCEGPLTFKHVIQMQYCKTASLCLDLPESCRTTFSITLQFAPKVEWLDLYTSSQNESHLIDSYQNIELRKQRFQCRIKWGCECRCVQTWRWSVNDVCKRCSVQHSAA